ncbi:MAG: M23 family metallopeptidase, partial [Alphaproteobacteria bacterium]
MNPFVCLLGACFWRRLALALALCLWLAGTAGAVPINPQPAPAPAATAKPDAAKPGETPAASTPESESKDEVKSIAEIRNDLAKSCFGGPIIAFGFAVPMIFGEKLHETFAPYVSGVLMIIFAIWAYLKVGSALLPFGPKDKAASLFNAIGVRFFVVLGVSVLLLAPKTGYGVYRDYIITPILSAGSTIVQKMYEIGVDTNPTLAKFAEEDGQCTPTTIKGLDAKLTALKDDLECKVCMIQRAYSYPWSYGLFQVGNGKIFTGIVLMLVGIAPFLMFLFTVADVFMVRMGYVSCTLSAYVAAGCFPASRKYAITGLKSLSDGAMVLITSMIAAMISISMLTTVIENLDKGGQASFAGTKTETPLSAPLYSSGMATQASNIQDPTTTYATGRMGGASLSYAAWYRDTYLRQDPPQGGFDTFREKMLSDIGLGGVTLNSPFIGSPPPQSKTVSSDQSFGWCRAHWWGRSTPYHNGLDFGCGSGGQPMTPIAPCEVIYAGWGWGYGNILDCRILLPDGSKSNVAFRYAHMMADAPKFAPGTRLNPGQVVGKCGSTGFSKGAHLHLEIYMDSANVPTLYPGDASKGLCGKSAGHKSGAPAAFGRNAYYLNPALLLAGAVPIEGIEAAGFSAKANSFKNFGILNNGFLLVVIICIVSLQILKQSQKFLSSQGMGMFMKALGQMISGAFAALGSVFTVGAKAAQALAPVAGGIAGAAGNMAGGVAGAALQATGLDKPFNRAAEGIQKTFDNVTQGLSGVMDNIGS